MGLNIKHSYVNNTAFVWHSLKKGIPLALLLIWFFQCRFWWRNYLLFTIFPYVFSFAKIFRTALLIETKLVGEYLWPGIFGVAVVVLIFVFDKFLNEKKRTILNDKVFKNHFLIQKKP
ncbi:hypothetical protein [Maribacter sp. 2-571]|uniref:hypothetical protein n=1 Tax=Maribacter sp. 2-571 TaxID=3417569 RepID=UPI003D33859C